jgi:hypothetical protein
MVLQTYFAQEAQEMLSTKIRTTLIALAAVASIGGSFIVPASSQANLPPLTPQAFGEWCDDMQFGYNSEVAQGLKYASEFRYAEAINHLVNAESIKDAAKLNGCKWAFSTLAPVSTAPPVAVSPSRVAATAKA